MIGICRFPKQSSRKEAKSMGHQMAWQLLEQLLRQAHGLSLPDLSVAYGIHGKPYLSDFPEIHFSLTHCNGLAACILADRLVGIDAEPVERVHEGAMRRLFSLEEISAVHEADRPVEKFCEIWTRKESYAKATGQGLLRTCQGGADAGYETRFLPDGYCLTVCYL